MCSCGDPDPSYVCVTHLDTRHDPGYFLVDDTPQDEPERERPSEYEVSDG